MNVKVTHKKYYYVIEIPRGSYSFANYVVDLSWGITHDGNVQLKPIFNEQRDPLYFDNKVLAEKVCKIANEGQGIEKYEVRESSMNVFNEVD